MRRALDALNRGHYRFGVEEAGRLWKVWVERDDAGKGGLASAGGYVVLVERRPAPGRSLDGPVWRLLAELFRKAASRQAGRCADERTLELYRLLDAALKASARLAGGVGLLEPALEYPGDLHHLLRAQRERLPAA